MREMKDHFHERMQRVLLFEPLYRLSRRTVKAEDGSVLSYMELGLMSLLFFFANMLDGKKKASARDLAAALQECTAGRLALGEAEFEGIAREIVAVLRPPTGKRNEMKFFNWETCAADQVQYSYLKAQRADLAANEQFYVLDEQGLELIFATKEYFSEFQLSINQLILRKQLEKGEFVLALRQIEEMRLDVETLKEQILRVGNEVHRNIISEDTLVRYRKIIDDINVRLRIEESEFIQLKVFIVQTREHFTSSAADQIERKAYEHILLVEKHLDEVHGKHRKLLTLCIELENTALHAAEEALYFSGIHLFNFEHEIADRVFASPLPLHAARILVKPFLCMEQMHVWSPLAVFLPQRLERDRAQAATESFPTYQDKAEDMCSLKNLQVHYVRIAEQLVAAAGAKQRTTLTEFLSYMRRHAQDKLLDAKQFYLFWIILHRKGSLVFTADQIGEKSAFYEIIRAVPALRRIEVRERRTVLSINEKYSISDMDIRVEVE